MDAATKNRVQVKIFVGFKLKVDLNIALNNNPKWKEAKVSKTTDLLEVHYKEKDYIGQFLTHEMVSMKNLQAVAAQIREELESFCPEYNQSALKIQIFPQIFVS